MGVVMESINRVHFLKLSSNSNKTEKEETWDSEVLYLHSATGC